jgi:AraC family transcriptional regulator
VRPGQFLILNNGQEYSCRVDGPEATRIISVFFRNEFACAVMKDILRDDEASLDDPFETGQSAPRFLQTLRDTRPGLNQKLMALIHALDEHGDSNDVVDEHLVLLLRELIETHEEDIARARTVDAIKSSTKKEVYKRLCVARDLMHSSFMSKPDLARISDAACLSIPQLVRQFNAVFKTSPHQYLNRIRLEHAANMLRHSDTPVNKITQGCGFENASAFIRSFKAVYGVTPLHFRAISHSH